MKRNIGVLIALFFQMLNALGINIDVSQTDIDTIGSGIGGAVAVIGVVHDAIRRYKIKKVGVKG